MKVFNFIVISIVAAFNFPQNLMKRAAKSVSENRHRNNEIIEENISVKIYKSILELQNFSGHVFNARLHELLCRK